MIDSGNVAAVVSAAAAVTGVYLAVRSSIRKDHRDQERADATQRRDEIDAAIKAERERQALADALAKIDELERRDRGDG